MKKHFFALAVIGIAACCLGACGEFGDNAQYEALNAMLEVNYSVIDITVSNTFEENISLTSEYKMTYSSDSVRVEYTVEEFAETSLDNPSPNAKTKLKGEATIKNGNVTFDGDEVPLTAQIANLGFSFKQDYFKNASLTNTSLSADVVSPSDFWGSTLACTNMKVKATFREAFSSLQITYTSSIGSQVKYTYSFTI